MKRTETDRPHIQQIVTHVGRSQCLEHMFLPEMNLELRGKNKQHFIRRSSGLRLKTAMQENENRVKARLHWGERGTEAGEVPRRPGPLRTQAPFPSPPAPPFGDEAPALSERERRQPSRPTKGRGLRAPRHRFCLQTQFPRCLKVYK